MGTPSSFINNKPTNKDFLSLLFVYCVFECAHVWEQIHQCKHIDLTVGGLVHSVTLPTVLSSKLITHDEMINLVYVPLSVHCTHPSVLLSFSLLSSEGFLLGAQPSLIPLTGLFYTNIKGIGRGQLKLICHTLSLSCTFLLPYLDSDIIVDKFDILLLYFLKFVTALNNERIQL